MRRRTRRRRSPERWSTACSTPRSSSRGRLRATSAGPGRQLAHGRFPSMAEVMRLVHVVGDVRNLYAAFFLGEVERLTGPVGLAVMGSPRAPLPAGEIAAMVARLNALPAADRQRLRIS